MKLVYAGWVGCREMHMYVKSSLGMLRREGWVPALCQKVSTSPGSGLCGCTVLCGQAWISSGEHLVQLLCHNLPMFLAHL